MLSLKMILTGPATLLTFVYKLSMSSLEINAPSLNLVSDNVPDLVLGQHVHHFPHLGVGQDHLPLLLREGPVTNKSVAEY